MKHWDGRDLSQADAQPLSRRERQRIRAMFLEQPANRRQERAHMGSVIGLVLAVGLIAGLAWLLSPSSPVSSDLIP